MVRLPDQRSADRLPTLFPSSCFFLLASINSTGQMRRSSRRRTYISLACNTSFQPPTTLVFFRHLRGLNTPRGFNRDHSTYHTAQNGGRQGQQPNILSIVFLRNSYRLVLGSLEAGADFSWAFSVARVLIRWRKY
jgi:hypothetical protein